MELQLNCRESSWVTDWTLAGEMPYNQGQTDETISPQCDW